MLLVILGAGASHDSAQAYRPVPGGGSDGEPWRPPLAKDLFLDRYRAVGNIVANYPKLTHILPYLREPSRGRSVEQMLETLQEEGKDNPESLREFASVRFYLCELLFKVTNEWIARTNGVTNYAPLIRDILRANNSREPVCLVTFNYDLLLERALYTFGFKVREPEEYLDSHPILKLFKLHGSVDWCRLADLPSGTRLTPQGLIEQADTIHPTDKFVRATATEPGEFTRFDKPVFPAIAIPLQTKTEQHFECPVAHRNYLESMLPRITKILIIGWQAREAHFLQMLRSNHPSLRHVMVVGANASDSEHTLKYFLEEIGPPAPSQSTGLGGFTDFIVNQEGYSFLNA